MIPILILLSVISSTSERYELNEESFIEFQYMIFK